MATLLLFLLLGTPTVGRSPELEEHWFRQEFPGPTSPDGWNLKGGEWRTTDSGLAISTKDYDRLAAGPFWCHASSPYTVTVTLRGDRAGVFFAIENRASKALAQMVRFEGRNLLSGYFTAAGEFVATATLEAPRRATSWTILAVAVNPERGTITISVDGVTAGVDTLLRYPSGFVGLQASEGESFFRNLTVTGPAGARTPVRHRPGETVRFAHVSRVRTEGNHLEVFRPELRLAQTIDRNGLLVRERQSEGQEMDSAARASGAYRIESGLLLRRGNGRPDTIRGRLVSPEALAPAGPGAVFVADPGANAVFLVRDREVVRAYRASGIGGFKAPRGLAVVDAKLLAVADYDRIVQIPRSLEETEPTVTPLSGNSVRLAWRGTSVPGNAAYAPDGARASWRSAPVRAHGESAGVTLTGLLPGTRYSARIAPLVETIPPGRGNSSVVRFVTPPAERGRMLLTRLPVLCMVYRSVSYEDRYPARLYPRLPRGRRMTDGEIDTLRRACAFNTEFFFRNSGCRVVLDFDVHVIEEPLLLGEIGSADPYWLEPNARVTADFERAAAALGRTPQSYAGLIVPYAWINHPPRRTSALRDTSRGDTITIRQAYGGGTYGVPAPWKYGYHAGYTGNPFQDRFSRQDWLITHEFHHQVDALMEASGFPSYHHADQPWTMPGRFGEDFDFNAAIIRLAPRGAWEALRFGRLAETTDRDMDGLPDDDRTLPADERRLHSSPASHDTDADGLSDLQEYMAGGSHGTDPARQDSDADGLTDGGDGAPLTPLPTVWQENRFHAARVTFGERLQATLTTAWSPTGLNVRIATSTPVNALLQIDAENDGWFHGFDNYQLRVHALDSAARVQEYYLRDCSSWSDPPRDRKDILDSSSVTVARETDFAVDDSPLYELTLVIPPDPAHGLEFKPGKRFAYRLGVQTVDDRWVWEELFERNSMLSVALR
jgi:hypothetical protein